MKCHNSPFCSNTLPPKPFACIKCERAIYCSPQCRKKNRAIHSKECVPPESNRKSLVEVCEQIVDLDEGTRARLDNETFQKDIDEGYKWYLEWSGRERSASNFTPEAEWALLYVAIIQKLDEVIHINHGIVHWKDGNRENNEISNVSFVHLCDALVHFETGCEFISPGEQKDERNASVGGKTPATNPETSSASKPSPRAEMNLLDLLRKEEIVFLKENSDFLWIVYGKYSNYSEIPISISPSVDWRNSLKEFESEDFREVQKKKKVEYDGRRRRQAYYDFLENTESDSKVKEVELIDDERKPKKKPKKSKSDKH